MGVYSQLELQSGTGEGTRGRENRSSGAWFSFAGVSALLGWGFHEIADPVYYDASSVSDYLAVVALTSVFVATGIALILLWRNPPVARGSVFLLFAGVGAAAEGLPMNQEIGGGSGVWAHRRSLSPESLGSSSVWVDGLAAGRSSWTGVKHWRLRWRL